MTKKPGTKLGLAALGVAVGLFVGWFYMNRQVGIAEDRTLFVLGFLLAVVLGVGAFVRGTRWYGGLAAVFAILIGIFLPFTMAVSRQEVAPGVIQVGDTIPQFRALDEFGEWFESESLQDQLVFIKFFRAHW
ncbi:MAG: hypothetical protein VCC00_14345 [Deltaproteobacteria bacterium]